MKRNIVLFAPILLLLIAYVNLNARTSARIIYYLDQKSAGSPTYFVAASQKQTQTQTKPQTQTQTQAESQSQSQPQTLYIGFPVELKWKYRTNSPIIAQPQTDSTTVYVATKGGYIHRVKQDDGTGVWKFNLGDGVEDAFLLNNGVLYVGTQRGFLFAFRADNGKQIWSQRLSEESFLTFPAISGNYVYFVGVHGTIVCLNAEDGDFIWKFKVNADCLTAPFVQNGLVFAGCNDRNFYALDAKAGFVKWKYIAGAEVAGSPIANNECVFFGSDDGYFYCLRIDNGK
ncbi:MAG: hypothetical protein C5B54_06565, partial [Acidobacteria bacterium]